MDRTRRRFDTAARQAGRRAQAVAAARNSGGGGGGQRGGRPSFQQGDFGRSERGDSRIRGRQPRASGRDSYAVRRILREVDVRANEARRAPRRRGPNQNNRAVRSGGGRFEDFMPRRALQGFASFGRRREQVTQARQAAQGRELRQGRRTGLRQPLRRDFQAQAPSRRIGRGPSQQQAPSGRFRGQLNDRDDLPSRRGPRGNRARSPPLPPPRQQRGGGGARGQRGRGEGGRGPLTREFLDQQLMSMMQ